MENYEDDANPFASMLLGERNTQNHVESVSNFSHHEQQMNENYEMYSEVNYKLEPEISIKQESFDGSYSTMNDSGANFMSDLDSKSFPEHPDFSAAPETSENKIRKKGRPKGAKTGTGKKRPPQVKIKTNDGSSIPKMKHNIHTLKLTSEQLEELKKVPSFFQPGVCYKIAPYLNMCRECFRKMDKRRQIKGSVECRFYQFRKLRFNGDEMEVAGFLDPTTDPVEVDRNIWLPQSEKLRHKSLSPQNARLILTHVGEELCQLIEKEKIYYEKFKTPGKIIIWKRLIDGVLEICDLCSTTLFNFHFICVFCGISLCVDCVMEKKQEEFDIGCSKKEQLKHSFEHLSLTQIIMDGAMEKFQQILHETCYLWDVEHNCELMKTPPDIDKATMTLVKNLLHEMKTGKSVISREIPHQSNSIEVDLSKLREPQEALELNLNIDDFIKTPHQKRHCKPIRHFTSAGKENVMSISRRMSQATSSMFYPDVPHRWLCENKLLCLLDPLCPGNDAFFHEQWQRGQPVLISNLLDQLKQELWIPQSFSDEFGSDHSDFINCMTGNLVRNKEISVFWDGFENVEKRLMDNEGKPMLLKLKDWPPDSDFKNIMPSRFDDIMKNFPLNSYTNRNGDLNIVKYLPSCFLHPDLGPKGYFAYGSPFFLKEGTTNLHLDVSDACNVMCYVGFPRDKKISIDEYIDQGFKAILEADADVANVNRVIEDGEIPGAIWHIFEAVDADRIRDFLLKVAQERGFQVADDHDVIHDQNWYLDGELRARLFKEYGVKGYAIVQCLGDCIILPAGTPHQVRNIFSCIKIAEDFVSPQQVAHCLHLSNEFRRLTKTHTNNEEKLNIKNVAYHSCKEAIATLMNLTKKKNSFYIK